MNFQKLAGILIPALFISFLFFYNPNMNTNQRQDEPVTTSFQSRLKDADVSNLEKREEIAELETSVVEDGTSSGNSEAQDRVVQTGDEITVHYRGWRASDGFVFDQSFNHSENGFTFTVGSGVIEGWSEGVVGMKVGEIRRLYIPSEKGYGEFGAGEDIPANTDLIFDVELIRFDD